MESYATRRYAQKNVATLWVLQKSRHILQFLFLFQNLVKVMTSY